MTEFDDIKRMLDIMAEHDIEELELERDGVRVRLRKRSESLVPGAAVSAVVPAATPVPATAATVPAADDVTENGLMLVKSPIVGTFYRAREAGGEPFVEVGTAVRRGQVLCIIEAMKLMNEIDAEQDGEVVSILVENGQPVQYGETLFTIRPA